ncbi:MAG: class I SAM-dependent methyltransferase [Candidatus Methanoperedens sp.]|nr:class I SAM-dependent methyltransferase [Candidatus Methanoperedens sp.]
MNITYRNTAVKTMPQVYEPSEDSFLLADAALSEIKGTERVLEVGCGSGIVSAVIKANTGAKVIGIDINPYAARCTKENGIEAVRGDLLGCIKGRFDIILFNPPYLPTAEEERTRDWLNAALDGGYDGKRTIYRFLEDAGNCLARGGKILMLVSSLTGIEEVKSRMRALGYAVEERRQERFSFEILTVIAAAKA